MSSKVILPMLAVVQEGKYLALLVPPVKREYSAYYIVELQGFLILQSNPGSSNTLLLPPRMLGVINESECNLAPCVLQCMPFIHTTSIQLRDLLNFVEQSM